MTPSRHWVTLAGLLLSAGLTLGCGARSGLETAPTDAAAPRDAGLRDSGRTDAGRIDAGPPAGDAGIDAGPLCLEERAGCGVEELCGDGDDDDCDAHVDEGCDCEPGAVQSCFIGAPDKRGVGACSDGAQICAMSRTWGPCTGGIGPDPNACTGRDDDCDACPDEVVCELDCPGPGDPRLTVGRPFERYPLRARDHYDGAIEAVRWRVRGGPCDALAPNLESFELEGARETDATLVPRLSGDYGVTLEITVPGGEVLSCTWQVNVSGPGLRVEMCYPESETQDLDLYLHRPGSTQSWFYRPDDTAAIHPHAVCSWHACEATIRADAAAGGPEPRTDWGYTNSDLSECENGPLGEQWRELGFCANPRLDIDNNLREGVGLPENINVDAPRDGQTFRVMVHNWSGPEAHPRINVYCGGERISTFGAAPDIIEGFEGYPQTLIGPIGAMWHVADITTRVDAAGETIGCDVTRLSAADGSGYRISQDDYRF